MDSEQEVEELRDCYEQIRKKRRPDGLTQQVTEGIVKGLAEVIKELPQIKQPPAKSTHSASRVIEAMNDMGDKQLEAIHALRKTPDAKKSRTTSGSPNSISSSVAKKKMTSLYETVMGGLPNKEIKERLDKYKIEWDNNDFRCLKRKSKRIAELAILMSQDEIKNMKQQSDQ